MAAALLLALGAARCGGGSSSPVQSTGTTGTQLLGTFLSAGSFTNALSDGPAGDFTGMTVEVSTNPSISTSVSDSGSFTLRGLPDGSFTLVFRQNGNPIGELDFDAVLPNQEIRVTVRLTDTGSVALVDQRRNGIGHGDVEIEGTVSAIQAGTGPNDGTLTVNNYQIVSQTGQTTIRQGNRSFTIADITVGTRVHVKGVWNAPQGATQQVLAQEIKLQGQGQGAPGTPTGGGNQCANINGARVGERIELEGKVDTVNGTSFALLVNGNRATGITVNLNGVTPTCNGNKTTTCTLQTGNQVHVSGTLTDCNNVAATSVRIQK